MIEKPLVSIVVPCYNREKYIETCINSVLSQDYENWECIIINDGSKDNTLSLVRSFELKENRICVIDQHNLGVSEARNKGIDHANGDFLFFLDSDDMLSNDVISSFVAAYENNDIITGVITAMAFADQSVGNDSQVLHPKEGNITFENNNFEVLIRTMESGLTPVVQNRLYRKDFIDENNFRFKPGIVHEDELWFFETMLLAKNVKFVNKKTYFYRIDHQHSITKNIDDKNLESYLQIMEEIVQNYSKNERYSTIAKWYAVYIKKIFLDFAIRDQSILSEGVILKLESALKENYIALSNENILSKNNEIYYKSINKLSLQNFSIIQKYFFRNPVNSLRKIINVLKISYFLK